MGKHRLDKSRALQVEVKETFIGQWKEWVRTPNGSGSGQSLPFNSMHNAIIYGIEGIRRDSDILYRGEYGPQYYITIVRNPRKFEASENDHWINTSREMAYDGERRKNWKASQATRQE